MAAGISITGIVLRLGGRGVAKRWEAARSPPSGTKARRPHARTTTSLPRRPAPTFLLQLPSPASPLTSSSATVAPLHFCILEAKAEAAAGELRSSEVTATNSETLICSGMLPLSPPRWGLQGSCCCCCCRRGARRVGGRRRPFGSLSFHTPACCSRSELPACLPAGASPRLLVRYFPSLLPRLALQSRGERVTALCGREPVKDNVPPIPFSRLAWPQYVHDAAGGDATRREPVACLDGCEGPLGAYA